MRPITKGILIFLAGTFEQMLYTLYLLAVGQYMVGASTILMFTYMSIYLMIINFAMKDTKNSILMLVTYAAASGLGNWIAMSLKLIK